MRSCVGPLCRQARVITWLQVDRALEWAACLPGVSGSSKGVIMGASPEEMDGGA